MHNSETTKHITPVEVRIKGAPKSGLARVEDQIKGAPKSGLPRGNLEARLVPAKATFVAM